jgi:hypothetical protein
MSEEIIKEVKPKKKDKFGNKPKKFEKKEFVKKPFKKTPLINIDAIKKAVEAEAKSNEKLKDFTIEVKTETSEIDGKTFTRNSVVMYNNTNEEVRESTDVSFKIRRYGDTNAEIKKILFWMKKQPKRILGLLRDYETIDMNKTKNDNLFKKTFHSLGKRF